MRTLKGFTFLSVIFTLFLSGQAIAQSDRGIEARTFNGEQLHSARTFDMGQPHSALDLPASKLRKRLESLPTKARARGLRALQTFSFPQADVDTLSIDDTGNIFYTDTLLPDSELAAAAQAAPPTLPEDVPTATLDDAFKLHSRPGSSKVVFLDFDGAEVSDTAWNDEVSTIYAVPYNIEGSDSTFSVAERTRIVDIWHRVAEDFAPFDIDVTTEEPDVFTETTGHVVITSRLDANDEVIECSSCGGVAYVGAFGGSMYAYLSPAWVFFDNLGEGSEVFVAEAASHEFGHNLGLSHDGDTNGGTYYSGHGSGLVSWAPIMGNSYYKNVTQWSSGEYEGANQTQDDLSIISRKLSYIPDDHGDNSTTATSLIIDTDGAVVSSNPELDPHNLLTQNKGFIGSSSDVDVFLFTVSAGEVDLTVRPAWDAFYRSNSKRGANLDIEAQLHDLNGNPIAFSEPENNTDARLTVYVEAGTYSLSITGRGNAITPYSDYASLGQYFINGVVSPDDGMPVAPVADFTFTSTELKTDFIDTSDSTDGSVTAWSWDFGEGSTSSEQNPTHTYAGRGTYTVMLAVTDNNGATDSFSQQVSVTEADDQPPTTPAYLQVEAVTLSTINISWSSSTDNVAVAFYDIFRDGVALTTATGTSYSDRGLASGEAHEYRVCAQDAAGNQSHLTDAVTATTNVAPTAAFTFSSEYLVTGFSDTSSDSDGTLTNWSWNFGDGRVSSSKNPHHTYANKGTYTVVLTVTDNNGATNATSRSVVAKPVDVITLIDAVYTPDKGEFKVRATSSAQPGVTLEVVGFGAMIYTSGQYEYGLNPDGRTTIPATINIVSSGGAVLTVAVVVEQQTSVPGQASSPTPANGKVGVSISGSLNWTAGTNTDTHVVYFGTSQIPPMIGSQSSTGLVTGVLNERTTYYWRVDEVNEQGTTVGTTWSFTTRDAAGKDKIVITKAEWIASRTQLKVEATSSGAAGTVLSVAGFGRMSYDSSKNVYSFIQNSVSNNPGSVTITSSMGGSGSKVVSKS
jgi:PKD repeat protein